MVIANFLSLVYYVITEEKSIRKSDVVIVCAEVSVKTHTICTGNQLTSFLMIGALLTERYSRIDHNIFS